MYKTALMANNFVSFYKAALRAIDAGLTYNQIKEGASNIIFRLSQQKYEVRRLFLTVS
jgi:V-type H+-transporting ATPase subunit A